MSSFFGKLFKPNKKREAIDDYGVSSTTNRRPTRPDSQRVLKSSMRRRHAALAFDETCAPANPSLPYHFDPQPQTRRGPRSAPIAFDDYSPNQSPSSSTDGTSGMLERSFQSEFIPQRSNRRHGSSGGRHVSPPGHHRQHGKAHRKSRNRRYEDVDDSDSENTHCDREYELATAVKQIKKYKTSLANAIDESRKLESDKAFTDRENRELRKVNRQLSHDYDMLKTDYERLKSNSLMDQQRIVQLQEEVSSYRSYLYQSCAPVAPSRYMYQPSMPFAPFMTPPSSIRTNLNNTNTGNSTLINTQTGQNVGGPGFRPPPTMGDGGSGESLAFMSATTINSGPKAARLMMPTATVDEMVDEVKVFRRNENSPVRSLAHEELLSSYNSFGSNTGATVPPPWVTKSTDSSPKGDKTLETEAKSTHEQTSMVETTLPEQSLPPPITANPSEIASNSPLAPPNVNSKLAKFEMLIKTQSHSLTPQFTHVPKRHNSAEDFNSVIQKTPT